MASGQTIWLASYPKSGNTWVRALLHALTHGGSVDINRIEHGHVAGDPGLVERFSGIVASDLTATEIQWLRPRVDLALDRRLGHPHYRKIHDALFSGAAGAPIISVPATRAAVYIVRDPRDVAVSFAHHSGHSTAWAVERLADPSTAQDAATGTILPQLRQRLGAWSDHVEGWTSQELFPVVVVRYEDLHADPVRALTRIAAVAEIDAGRGAIEAAVQAAAFERLRAQELAGGFRERSRASAEFFRRGVSGTWTEELPAALARRVESDHGELMARLGYSS